MYVKPELFVEEFDLEDVITASGSPVTGTDGGMGSGDAIVEGPGMAGGSNDDPFDDEDPWDPFADLFPMG